MPIIRHPETPFMVPRQVFEDWRLSPQTRWILATMYAGKEDEFTSESVTSRYSMAENAPSSASLEQSMLSLIRCGYLVVSALDKSMTLAAPMDVKIPECGVTK